MRKLLLSILLFAVQTVLLAQAYYPEGTKWTEVRLDTLRHDSWYSKAGDEWVSNFETIEYHVRGDYTDKNGNHYRCVYTNGPEWTDSLTLLIQEGEDAWYAAWYAEHNCVLVTVLGDDYEGGYRPLVSALAYQFDWSVGKGLYFEDIVMSNTTSFLRSRWYYGTIAEIKEGYFGGIRPLKYVDLDGKAPDNDPNSGVKNIATRGGRIIHGVGITEWNGSECLFGPPNPYFALYFETQSERQYRSKLVRFERDGEVLYNVWPEKETTDCVNPVEKSNTQIINALYDLQGRRVTGIPRRPGVYVQDGRKVVVK